MILYVLDDDYTETALWRTLCHTHYPSICVRTFNNPKDFIEAIAFAPPSGAVIDLVIPFYTGSDICKWIHENYPSVSLYVNTGLQGDEFKVLAEICGAEFLSKSTPILERIEVVANGCKS